MPLEPGPLRHEVRTRAPHRQPPDLGGRPEPLPTEDPGEELTTEAQPEDRHIRVHRTLHESCLPRDEGLRVIEGRELRAERDDQVEAARVDVALLEVDAAEVDLGAALGEPRGHVARRRRVLVLEDQRPKGRVDPAHPPTSCLVIGVVWSSASTSSATARTASANRATISSSSSSGVVNGGAKRV